MESLDFMMNNNNNNNKYWKVEKREKEQIDAGRSEVAFRDDASSFGL